MQVEFKFKMLSKVTNQINGRSGVVVGAHIDQDGIKFANVRWVKADGTWETPWLRETELDLVKAS